MAPTRRLLSYSREVLFEREGSFVAFGFYCVCFAQFESGIADKACASTQREWNGNGIEELIIGIIDIDGLVFLDAETDEQGCRLLGGPGGRDRRHLAHSTAN